MKNTIQQYKNNHNLCHTEDIFGITHAAEHQCSNVDSLVKQSNDIGYWLDKADHALHWEEYKELEHHLKDIEYHNNGTEEAAEELREAIEKTREWGQQWKTLALEIMEKYEIPVEEILEMME